MGKSWTNKNIARSIDFDRRLHPSYYRTTSANTRLFNKPLSVTPAYSEITAPAIDYVAVVSSNGTRKDYPVRLSPKYTESVQAFWYESTTESYTFPPYQTTEPIVKPKVSRRLWLGGTLLTEPEDSGDKFVDVSYYQAYLDGKRLVTAATMRQGETILSIQGSPKLLISTYEVSGETGNKVITLIDRKRFQLPDVVFTSAASKYAHLTKYGYTMSQSEYVGSTQIDFASVWTAPVVRKVYWVLVDGYSISSFMTQRDEEYWTITRFPPPNEIASLNKVVDFGGKSYIWVHTHNYHTTYTGVQPVSNAADPYGITDDVLPIDRLETYTLVAKYVELKPTEEYAHITRHYEVSAISVDYWVLRSPYDIFLEIYYSPPLNYSDYQHLSEVNGSIEEGSQGVMNNTLLYIPDKGVEISQLKSRYISTGNESLTLSGGHQVLVNNGTRTSAVTYDVGLIYRKGGVETDLAEIIHQEVGLPTYPSANNFDFPVFCYNGKYLMIEFFRNYEAILVIDLSKSVFTYKVYKGSWGFTGSSSTVRPLTKDGTSY